MNRGAYISAKGNRGNNGKLDNRRNPIYIIFVYQGTYNEVHKS